MYTQPHPLRKGRCSIPNHHYAVTIVCHDRKRLFSSLTSAQIAINNLYLFDKQQDIQTICYVLMPNHLHWLFQLKNTLTLGQVVGQFKGRTSHQIKSATPSLERVWQAGYYDHCIRDEEDLIEQARYIVANPLRAKLVESVKDYPYWNCIYL